MVTIEIESWDDEPGFSNRDTAHAYQAVARNEFTGEILEEYPVRSYYEDVKEDARRLRQHYYKESE